MTTLRHHFSPSPDAEQKLKRSLGEALLITVAKCGRDAQTNSVRSAFVLVEIKEGVGQLDIHPNWNKILSAQLNLSDDYFARHAGSKSLINDLAGLARSMDVRGDWGSLIVFDETLQGLKKTKIMLDPGC